ncbi:MAG: M48 family metallopeptidase [Myxococcota bacterium]|jgi:Zn-dependent protease with chaperone function|nr:M48 family metallopeptidase [Myxococcota bacterium]
MTRRQLIDLDPSAWLHPEDQRLLKAFGRMPYSGRLIDWARTEQTHTVPHASLGPVIPLPEASRFYEVYREVLRVLDAPARWPIFVYPARSVNAMMFGGPQPYLVLTAGLLYSGDEAHLRFAMGHEVGHALAGHCQYHWALSRMTHLGWTALPFDPLLGAAAAMGLKLALQAWCRAGELSADRAGLLALQDPQAALRCLASFGTGRPPCGPFEVLGSLTSTHPECRRRVASLEAWVHGGDYAQILSGHYHRRSVDTGEPLNAAETELLLAARRELEQLGLYDPDEDAWQDPNAPPAEEMDELSRLIEEARKTREAQDPRE